MAGTLFWFSDEQWAKIEPHLPRNQRGPARKDDRRILSGIMHVLGIGCRWQEQGPHKTVYNAENKPKLAHRLAKHPDRASTSLRDRSERQRPLDRRP